MSESLSGLWIGPEEDCMDIPLEQEGVASLSLLHDTNSWYTVNLFLFVSL